LRNHASNVRNSARSRLNNACFRTVCIGCGTIPIYNESINVSICPLCDGPVKYSGNSVNNFEIIPPNKKQTAEIVKIEIPYSAKVLEQELENLNLIRKISVNLLSLNHRCFLSTFAY
jgi:DNA-directed RNA polymerase beta subunit